MAKQSFLKTLVLLFIIVVSGIFLDRYFFDRKITSIGPSLIKRPASTIFAKLENGRFFFKGLFNIRNLISENDDLKKDNLSLLSRLADYEDIKLENVFLRNAVKIAPRFERQIIYANIFSAQPGGGGYDILLTKGTHDNVNDNDVVITEEGVLLGMVKKSYDNFSSLIIITDPNFSITAKVLNSNTSGIAKGAMEKGLYFDLIVRGDPIREGDVVVSSGIDFFPPALVIGTVSHVDTNETGLFKKVKIQPALENVMVGRALVVKSKTRL
ncbi:MAG: rod shape-determining protein MreC [Candidatus Colwellbacteria bacterium]|nr:rod shape-determining protein MreC [Candidatus Colwellbacteria bacterium]